MEPVTPVAADELWAEIHLLHERWNVLRHPFYLRWSAGELDRRELKLYASEYHQAVVALAVVSQRAATKARGPFQLLLHDHAAEERAHIELWCEFAEGTGWRPGSALEYATDPYPETVQCARLWAGSAERPLALDLVTLYAIESSQHELATTKLEGLLERYGFEDGPATEYFRLHAEVDTHHAALARSALEETLTVTGEDPGSLLNQVEATHRGYWSLLDGLARAEL